MSLCISRKSLIYGFVYVFFIGCLILWVAGLLDEVSTIDYREKAFPWIILSFAINMIGLGAIKRVGFSHLGIWFVLLSYCFMFGHVFTYVFDLTTSLTWDPSPYYTEQSKYQATSYAVLAITLVSFGCFISAPMSTGSNSKQVGPAEQVCMRKAGTVCVAVGAMCSLINAFFVVSAAQSAGAYSIYMIADVSGLFDDLAYLLVPGVMMLMFSGTMSRASSTTILVTVLAYFFTVMVLSGSRKMAIFAIVALVAAYLRSGGRPSLTAKQWIVIVVCGTLFLNFIYIIREYRGDLSETVPSIISSLTSFEFMKGLLAETFTEMGLTFFSVAGIVQTVPAVFPYEMGLTLIKTVPSILPIGWLVGDFFDSAASTYVINQFIGVPVGASLLGDFYWNWGLIGGCIASFLFCVLVSRLGAKCSNSTLGMVVYYSIFYILLVGVRAGIFELFRPMVVAVLLPMLVFKYMQHTTLRKGAGNAYYSARSN